MNQQEAIREYLTLTDEIAALRARREQLKPRLAMGRNLGLLKDVYVGYSNTRTVSITSLKQYVSDKVIDLCCSTRNSLNYKVVDKEKPKKEKKDVRETRRKTVQKVPATSRAGERGINA